MMQDKLGIIILAAGSSSRLGRPKQLLDYNGKSLLQLTIDAALNVAGSQVIVVTGSNSHAVQQDTDLSKVTVCYNAAWETGMASSIRSGLGRLLEIRPDSSACILTVCDQPFVVEGVFNKLLLEFQRTRKPIIASSYADILGVPVLFSETYFPSLLVLTGFQGAKNMVESYSHDVAAVRFGRGQVDIDTQEDYDHLTRHS